MGLVSIPMVGFSAKMSKSKRRSRNNCPGCDDEMRRSTNKNGLQFKMREDISIPLSADELFINISNFVLSRIGHSMDDWTNQNDKFRCKFLGKCNRAACKLIFAIKSQPNFHKIQYSLLTFTHPEFNRIEILNISLKVIEDHSELENLIRFNIENSREKFLKISREAYCSTLRNIE